MSDEANLLLKDSEQEAVRALLLSRGGSYEDASAVGALTLTSHDTKCICLPGSVHNCPVVQSVLSEGARRDVDDWEQLLAKPPCELGASGGESSPMLVHGPGIALL